MMLGLIGNGVMGNNYAKIISELRGSDVTVACYDLDYQKAKDLADKYGFDAYSVLPVHLDAAIVAVNTPSHMDIIVRLLQNGTKHILCEKPLAMTPKEVRRIKRELEQYPDARVYTALVINFSGAIERLRAMMTTSSLVPLEMSGSWGKPRLLDKIARPSAGDVEDESVHPIGVMLALINQGLRACTVRGNVGSLRFVKPGVQEAAHARDASFPLTPNHSTSAMMWFNGVPLFVHSSFLLARQERLVRGVLGHESDRGTPTHSFEIEFDVRHEGGVADKLTIVDYAKGESVPPVFFGGDKLRLVAGSFLDAINGGPVDPRLADVNDAGLLVDIGTAIIESSRYEGAIERIHD